jgi:hypothetical protein
VRFRQRYGRDTVVAQSDSLNAIIYCRSNLREKDYNLINRNIVKIVVVEFFPGARHSDPSRSRKAARR